MASMGGKLLAAAIVLAYPLAAFYPYEWAVSLNRAEALPGEGLAFPGEGAVESAAPPDWVAEAIRLQRIDVSILARSSSARQRGPARIFTLSHDPHHRNLTIAQSGSEMVLRLRTPWTTENGEPEIHVPGVFGSRDWVDIGVMVRPGSLEVRIDGETRLRQEIPAAPLEGWDGSYRLALGNELTHDRPWRGEIRNAIVDAGGRQIDYATAAGLEIPPILWRPHRQPKLVPFRDIEPGDAVVNFLGFIPIGFLLGVWLRNRQGLLAWRPILLVLALTVSLEAAQFFTPDRFPSIDDVLLNLLGGTLGIIAARRAQQPVPAPLRVRLLGGHRAGHSVTVPSRSGAPPRGD